MFKYLMNKTKSILERRYLHTFLLQVNEIRDQVCIGNMDLVLIFFVSIFGDVTQNTTASFLFDMNL